MQYINKISKEDVYEFGIKNGIKLNNNSLDIIYNYVKNDWRTIIFGDITPIFNDLKNKLDSNTFNKIKNLYFEFKEKYKNYLQ